MPPGPLYYTIYLADEDTIVAFGDSTHCAKMLGMTLPSFYSMITRVSRGTNKKYEYYAEPLYLEEYAGEFDDDETTTGEGPEDYEEGDEYDHEEPKTYRSVFIGPEEGLV